MATQTKKYPPGFISTGTGPKGSAWGRDPATGRAYLRNGTVRAERVTLSAAERAKKAREDLQASMGGIGRKIVAELPTLESFRSHAGTFQKWGRDATAYGTPEAVAERRRYFERMLNVIDAKHNAAVGFLANPANRAAVDAIANLYSRVGQEYASFVDKNGRDPSEKEIDAIVSRLITPEIRATVESASNSDNDPFAEFRRDAMDFEAPGTGVLEEESGE